MVDDIELPESDVLTLEELSLAASPRPWVTHDGRIFWDDGEDDPDLRAETLVARFGKEDRNKADAHFVVMATNLVDKLLRGRRQDKAKILSARSQTARLADVIDKVIDEGAVDPIAAKELRGAIDQWVEDMRQDGLKVADATPVRAAGVQTVAQID